MKNDKRDSLAGRVVAAMRSEQNPFEVEARGLAEMTTPIEDWLNAQSQIDLIYCAYVLKTAYQFVLSLLDDDDLEQFENLKRRYRSVGVEYRVEEERP